MNIQFQTLISTLHLPLSIGRNSVALAVWLPSRSTCCNAASLQNKARKLLRTEIWSNQANGSWKWGTCYRPSFHPRTSWVGSHQTLEEEILGKRKSQHTLKETVSFTPLQPRGWRGLDSQPCELLFQFCVSEVLTAPLLVFLPLQI